MRASESPPGYSRLFDVNWKNSILMPSWFETLVGFQEGNPEQVRSHLELRSDQLYSSVNGQTYQFGKLEIAQLKDLRNSGEVTATFRAEELKVSEVVGDVQLFHVMPQNAGALFQAASQFNLLEMVHPGIWPEDGIARYEHDLTQGPACAIACGAGTIYRNYFVPIGDHVGQEGERQIDCLHGLSKYFDNAGRRLWTMENGYALATVTGLETLTHEIEALTYADYELLKGELAVGIQWDTEVTIAPRRQIVSQIYCSALPVAYSTASAAAWEVFSRLVLRATYEATFWAALRNRDHSGSNKLFLTRVGGGAFGNRDEWINTAILENLERFRHSGLEVFFISFGKRDPQVRALIDKFSSSKR